MRFRFTTAGESHGKALVAIVEGLPAGLAVDAEDVNHELRRRQMGYGRGGRMKIERDEVEFLSGIRHGKTIGSPVAMMIENRDFVHWKEVMSAEVPEVSPKIDRVVKRPRPGHADLAGGQKFQTRDLRNVLERASARETAARVASGALAKIFLRHFGIEVLSHVVKLGSEPAEPLVATAERVREIPADSPLRCVDTEAENAMIALIDKAKAEGDTLGGVFEVIATGVPVGLGSHTSWREKLDGSLARAVMSIQAVKAVEIGDGVANAGLFGSQAHDEITHDGDTYGRTRNRAGGLEGGITNGEELRVRGYKKPISTLRKRLRSVNIDSKDPEEAAFERSDITAVPAAELLAKRIGQNDRNHRLTDHAGGRNGGDVRSFEGRRRDR